MANYFTDRVVQHPGRITLTATGGSDEYDVDRAEGTVTTAGTPFNASTFNGMLDTYGAWYGTCSTAAGTQTKVVTCSGFTLVTGSFLVVKFDYGNTYNGRIKLNVNSTGAKDVYNLSEYSGDNYYCYFEDGAVMIFQYDGTQFRVANAAIITNAELTALETLLGVTTSTGGRLYDIINQIGTLRRETWTPTSGSAYASYGGCYYEIMGRQVHIHAGVSGLTSGAVNNVGTIASEARPSETVFGTGGAGNLNSYAQMEITSAGVMTIIPSNGTYCGVDVFFWK